MLKLALTRNAKITIQLYPFQIPDLLALLGELLSLHGEGEDLVTVLGDDRAVWVVELVGLSG